MPMTGIWCFEAAAIGSDFQSNQLRAEIVEFCHKLFCDKMTAGSQELRQDNSYRDYQLSSCLGCHELLCGKMTADSCLLFVKLAALIEAAVIASYVAR